MNWLCRLWLSDTVAFQMTKHRNAPHSQLAPIPKCVCLKDKRIYSKVTRVCYVDFYLSEIWKLMAKTADPLTAFKLKNGRSFYVILKQKLTWCKYSIPIKTS